MEQEHREHYEQLLPCLKNKAWRETGAKGYGSVYWRCPLPNFTEDGVEVAAQMSITVLPESFRLIVEIKSSIYPNSMYFSDAIDPEGLEHPEILAIGIATAVKLLSSKLEEIKQARKDWLEMPAREMAAIRQWQHGE